MDGTLRLILRDSHNFSRKFNNRYIFKGIPDAPEFNHRSEILEESTLYLSQKGNATGSPQS
jgi:hypothetical protein